MKGVIMFPRFSDIKADARYALGGIWGKVAFKEFLLFLIGGGQTFGTCLYELISLIIFNISVRFATESKYEGIINTITLIVIAHLIVSIIRMCLGSGMRIGMTRYYMALADKPSVEPNCGLTSHMKYFANDFMMCAARDIYTSLLTFFLIIPGIISYLKWSVAHFVIAENPDTRPSDALVESGYTMEGYKMKYFLFNLSFVPLLIVSSISIVGLFFVIPYMKMAQAKFYWHIKHPVYDKDKDLKELKTLKAEKFSFDDFVAEYEEKIARKQDQNLKK